MYKAYKTEIFSKWHDSLKGFKGKIAIARRIDRAEKGNFGDSEPVGESVFEILDPDIEFIIFSRVAKLSFCYAAAISPHKK